MIRVWPRRCIFTWQSKEKHSGQIVACLLALMWTVHWKKKQTNKAKKKRATKGVGSFEPVLHAWCNRLIMKISSSPASRSKVTTFSPLFVVWSIFSSSVRFSVPNRQLQFIQFNYYSSSFPFCFVIIPPYSVVMAFKCSLKYLGWNVFRQFYTFGTHPLWNTGIK